MRYHEIKHPIKLDELAMSPNALKRMAQATNAQAGMEFEMIVPDTSGGDDDSEQEPNYDDYDESVNDISGIADFFHDGDFNGRIEINQLREQMGSEYEDWVSESIGDAWASEGKDLLREYIENNEFNRDDALEDAYDQLGLTAEQKEAANQAGGSVTKLADTTGNEDWQNWKKATNMVEERLDELTDEAWDGMDRTYDRAFEEYSDEHREDFTEQDWLDSEGISYMSDVERQYQIMWPHWTSVDGGDQNIESIAGEFKQAIGRKVNWSASYHSGKREPNTYVVEPDGSLEPDNRDDSGLEFVSPPLPLNDMLSDLRKTIDWAKEKGAYTNNSTGLHMNVSIPGYSLDKLDFVKLAIFLGDEYVLNEFGRSANTYAKSAMQMVVSKITTQPEIVTAVLNKMRSTLNTSASKLIHTGITSKYTSINTKDNYIEFRSPGGDWLNADFAKLENTLLRFVVALDVACDESKNKQEYAKKLYKLLSPKGEDSTIDIFAKYSAGMLPAAALKSFIKQAQLQRTVGKEKPGAPAANYKIYRITDGRVMDTFQAVDRADAEEKFRDWTMSPPATEVGGYRYAPIDTVIRGPADQPIPGSTVDLQRQRAAQQSSGTWTGQWAIKDNRGNTLYTFGGVGNSQADANRTAAAWLARAGYQAGLEVEVVPVMGP